jgi:hypothetical protein
MPKSTNSKNKLAPRWKPFPWSRFSKQDFPREVPLPVCPALKCRRAKTCIAPHFGLFCQRTHFDRKEGQSRVHRSEMDKHIAGIAMPSASSTPDLHMVFLKEIAALRKADQNERMKLWRAGAFGDRYGPYTTKGVMMQPPPRIYAEE